MYKLEKKNVKKVTLVELINEVSGELYLKFPFTGENPFSHIFVAKAGSTGAQDPIYITCDYGQLKSLSATANKEGEEDGDGSKKVKGASAKREEEGEEKESVPQVSTYIEDSNFTSTPPRKKKKKKKSKDGEGKKKAKKKG